MTAEPWTCWECDLPVGELWLQVEHHTEEVPG